MSLNRPKEKGSKRELREREEERHVIEDERIE